MSRRGISLLEVLFSIFVVAVGLLSLASLIPAAKVLLVDAGKADRGMLRARRAFTLVELMVTMVIIALLAGMIMGGLFIAQEKAKATRTQTIITRLNRAVMARWESYRTRRLPVVTTDYTLSQGASAALRLNMRREMMRVELPNRYADITADLSAWPTCVAPLTNSGITQPALSTAYLRRVNNNKDDDGVAVAPTADYQGAECLHLIVTMGGLDDEAEGLDRFRHEDVGDFDEDGMLEFHDGWGQPISWVRWPAGFVSDLQPDADPVMVDTQRDRIGNHDPFDNMRLDPEYIVPVIPMAEWPLRGWRLVPLIYSPGPDGVQDLLTVNTATTAAELNDPYFRPSGGQFAGEPVDSDGDGLGHVDNIHNHLLGGAIR